MRVTVCQWDSRPEALAAQLQALLEHCRLAGSELLLLPEMPFDDWLAAAPQVDAERWALSVRRHLDALQRLAELPGLTLFATRPFVDKQGARLNRAFHWSAEAGLVDDRDKFHLPAEEGYWESSWYSPGKGDFACVGPASCRVGSLICSELWFLEHARDYGRQQAHVLCMPRATPALGNDAWLAAGRTAAIVAGAYCLSSNQYRPEGATPGMAGMGWVIDPDGTVLATTSANTPFVTLDVDLAYAEAAKHSYPRYLE
ncbi:carbon-nitrogen hydrolase family protein [Pseudomonas sp. MBLB4123]|uniref:carbon-nitrogen hydrolase family protein n=1 Tax=Pseudomonas sp. MBLB4123 TaxID=3451557 RepID=UPI003F74ADF0